MEGSIMDSVGDTQMEVIGRNIDRLVTVEARISDYSRGVIANLYDAARAAQGGRPLCLHAAELILASARPGRVVFFTTGAGDPRYLPAGETDGPPGLAVLARAVHQLTGAVPILLTEAAFVDNLAATALAAGLGRRMPEMVIGTPYTTAVLPLSDGPDAEAEAAALVARFDPCMMISVEKIGPNADGIAHTASGKPVAAGRARAECLFDLAAARNIPTLGVGDNGNEIGFGLIADAVKRYKPGGERLATRVVTDALMTANTSNWGAYAIVAALAVLTGRTELLHTAEMESRMLHACVAASGVDGSTGRHIPAVDGMPEEMQRAVVTMLGVIVGNGLISGYKRPF
jgi:hypothetical protein